MTASAVPPAHRPRATQTVAFTFGVLTVAIGTAAFATGFRSTLGLVTRSMSASGDIVSAMRALPWYGRLLLPTFGGLLAGILGLLVQRAPEGHGVGNVMEAVVLGRVHLSMRVTLMKSLASWFAIVTGGSLGREGPLIQFGGAVGNFVGQRLGLTLDRTRLLIACGTAAGFSAAYNTPFAAVLFVLEVVTGIVVLDAVLPALVSTVLAVVITRAVFGQGPVYGQRNFYLASTTELIAFGVLGIIAAAGAQLFMRLLSWAEHCFRRPNLPLPFRPALGGCLAGLAVTCLPDVAGNGYEPLNRLLDGQLSVGFVCWLLLGKYVATTASVGSGSPGGVFTPTLLLGGSLAYLYATALSALGITTGAPGGYALVGMAAATGATTHAPLMAAVMVFELSGDYSIVLPLILATAVATTVSRWVARDSIYSADLQQRGIRWEVTLEGRRLVDPDARH
ncbi:MAG TPA: chloride channel protein [Polyangiaceae bacterium]